MQTQKRLTLNFTRTLTIYVLMMVLSTCVWAGPETSGGGQVVWDQKTNKMYLIDLLTKEQLSTLRPDTSSQVSLKKVLDIHPCSKYFSISLEDSRFAESWNEVKEQIQQMERVEIVVAPYLKNFMDIGNFRVTAFPLPQIKDAVGVEPRFQFTGAYFWQGIPYLQAQVLSLMPKSHINGLIIKEGLRFVNFKLKLELQNEDIQVATRLLLYGRYGEFAQSKFSKAIDQKFERIQEIKNKMKQLEWREELLVGIKSTHPDYKVREKARRDLVSVSAKMLSLSVDLMHAQETMDFRPLTAFLLNDMATVGVPPLWIMNRFKGEALEELEVTLGEGGEAPFAKAWDIYTGKEVLNFGKGCFEY